MKFEVGYSMGHAGSGIIQSSQLISGPFNWVMAERNYSGTGCILYCQFINNVFANGFYLLNTREKNGVSNLNGRNASSSEIANNTTVMSVPDQYSFRGGAGISIK